MNAKTFIRLSETATQIAEAETFVLDDQCGAVATFVGVTRRDKVPDRGEVMALEFEAHVSLAEAVLFQIVEEHRLSNPDLRHVFIHHRMGTVAVGEGNVVIAVSSPHRTSAFRALEAIMSGLKAKAPIWKKELFTDKSYRWQENAEFNPY